MATERIILTNDEMLASIAHHMRMIEPLHPSEIKLIAFVRALGYGDLIVTVKDGYPVLIKRPIQTVKLV